MHRSDLSSTPSCSVKCSGVFNYFVTYLVVYHSLLINRQEPSFDLFSKMSPDVRVSSWSINFVNEEIRCVLNNQIKTFNLHHESETYFPDLSFGSPLVIYTLHQPERLLHRETISEDRLESIRATISIIKISHRLTLAGTLNEFHNQCRSDTSYCQFDICEIFVNNGICHSSTKFKLVYRSQCLKIKKAQEFI